MFEDAEEGAAVKTVRCFRCGEGFEIDRLKVDDETCQRCDDELAEIVENGF